MARPKTIDPKKLVELFGSHVATAEFLGITKQAVGKWIRRRRPVPERHYIKLANKFPEQYGHLLRG